ncbi:terpenoid synthase [Macrolepiota fuliginosa MF-IS2]|uniref:Terpenoid synthase n=1 Tax=Macrolepiota fuliginosa MF-IS2 TaxID=1400762 RepID=A0A9P6BYB8_9AGAR|nr:terpenoid synthase [Macrolepiota fuliginosa MF-IS2]
MSLNKEEAPIFPTTKLQIRNILADYLKQCGIVYPRQVRLDESFRADCYADAERRGFDMEAIKGSLDTGIAFVATSYQHLDNYSTRVYTAVWSGIMTQMDDYYETYSDGLGEFSSRYIHREPQCHQVLDQLVTMMHELPQHWGAIATGLILTTQMDFLTSLIIDSVTVGMEIKPLMAPEYPLFSRHMTGMSRAYAIIAFPPELDLKSWIQVLPDLMHYINHTNDLLSFFKEELDSETVNFISLSASSNGITKLEALRSIADRTAQCYERGSRLLEASPVAWKAYRSFCVGYIGFHALAGRYKLDQLVL